MYEQNTFLMPIVSVDALKFSSTGTPVPYRYVHYSYLKLNDPFKTGASAYVHLKYTNKMIQ